MIWRGMEIFGQQGIRFVIGIVLVRLLLPEQFGIIAMLTVFIMLAEVFINSGFGQALIQKKMLTILMSVRFFTIMFLFL